ncbi:hypothetical protein [Rhodanobacter sp. DHG33]|uniref:hypothetical protein n=1 Tax=Rhodanobacter sp. DHG33 TaxID=2775921 RepID=UPI00177EE5C2|nr:hypothetical protein [Rhodanobacter sp. DHG33]MBD8900490.1 hypothetical protein [Rhodanobacter sp. DHG33]
MPADSAPAVRGFAPWRVAVWLLLLLAAFGCVQYIGHAQLMWAQQADASPADSAALHGMLAWDVGYFVVAFAVIVLCAGCILRQAWARTPLRVACGLLALWALVGGGMMLARWPQFDRASADALAQLGSDALMRSAVLHARRVYRITLVLKAVAIPLLLWLAWRLGTPAARMQFRQRR